MFIILFSDLLFVLFVVGIDSSIAIGLLVGEVGHFLDAGDPLSPNFPNKILDCSHEGINHVVFGDVVELILLAGEALDIVP